MADYIKKIGIIAGILIIATAIGFFNYLFISGINLGALIGLDSAPTGSVASPVGSVGDATAAYYKLNGNANDEKGNNGQVFGAVFETGKLGQAAKFDGLDDYIKISSSAVDNIINEVAVSAWINISLDNRDQKIFSTENNVAGGFKLGIYANNKVEFEVRDSANKYSLNRDVAGGTVLQKNQWYHVVGVYSKSGNYIKTYVNGNLDRTISNISILGITGGDNAIGKEAFVDKYYFGGMIDKLKVFNRVLSESEILTEYTSEETELVIDSAKFKGEYFNNISLQGTPALIRSDDNIDFSWGLLSPASGIIVDGFSVRWTKTIDFEAGNYVFTTTSDDGVRLYVDNNLIINKWILQSVASYTGTVNLSKGTHNIKMEYYENTRNALAKLSWSVVDAIQVNKCSDNTVYGSCSTTKPKECVNGALVNNCSKCGCASGTSCQADGTCAVVTSSCTTNSQCGVNGLVGDPFCKNGNVYKSYKTYTCNNPGTASAACANVLTDQLVTTCTTNQTCSNGSCILAVSAKCSDNTVYGSCSTTKPKECVNGALVNNCSKCGCASGTSCQADGSCKAVAAGSKCFDGTVFATCSSRKPFYCNAGILVEDCARCGCERGACQADGSCLVAFQGSNVDLYVTEPSGVNRVNEPVTSGVPLPEGKVFSTNNLRLTDESGSEISTQFTVLSRWNGVVSDASKSIKWVLLDFQTSLAANQKKKFWLDFGTGVTRRAITDPIQISQSSGYLNVDTGAAQFKLSKNSFKLFDSVVSGGKEFIKLDDNKGINLAEASLNRLSAKAAGTTSIGVTEGKYFSVGDKFIIHNKYDGDNLWYAVKAGYVSTGLTSYKSLRTGDRVIFEPGTSNEEVMNISKSGWGCGSGCDCHMECVKFTTPFTKAHAGNSQVIRESTEEEYTITSISENTLTFTPGLRTEHFSGEFLELVSEENFDYWGNLEPSEVKIEEQGEMRTVINIRGKFKSDVYGDLGKKYIGSRLQQEYPWMKWNARVYFYKDKSYAKVFFTLENNGASGVWPEGKYAPTQLIYMDRLSLISGLNLGNSKTISTNEYSSSYTNQEFYLYQGGRSSYNIKKDGNLEATKEYSNGWVDINDGSSGFAVGVRHFGENFPKAVKVNNNKISLDLWPTEGSYAAGTSNKAYKFDGGRHKTHEILYNFYSGNLDKNIMNGLQEPLMIIAYPEWYADTKALGMVAPSGMTSEDPKVAEAMYRFEALQKGHVSGSNSLFQVMGYGWMNFGDLKWTSGMSSLHYDWTYSMLLHYIRTGYREFFDTGVMMARHRYDIDQYHGDRTDSLGDHKWMNYLSRYEKGDHGNGESTPKLSHTWNDGLIYYYWLTGDKKALEAAEETGKAVVLAYGDGTTKQTIAEIRTPGWAALMELNLYKATGKQEYLDLARNIVLNKILYTEQGRGGVGTFTSADIEWSTTYSYVTNPVILTHYYTQDPQIRDLILRMANFSKDRFLCPEYTNSKGKYVPIQVKYYWKLADRCAGGEAVKILYYGDLFAYAYMLNQDPSYLDWARRSFWNSIFYYTVDGNEGVNPSVRSPIGYHDRMFIGTETKTHGYIGRTNQIYLYMERQLQKNK